MDNYYPRESRLTTADSTVVFSKTVLCLLLRCGKQHSRDLADTTNIPSTTETKHSIFEALS